MTASDSVAMAHAIGNAITALGLKPYLFLLALSMAEVYGVADTVAAMELEAESGFEVDFEDILIG